MSAIYITGLSLENYRNFDNLQITANEEPVIIIGENGKGKTNILESISMLFPGRGIRNAKLEEMVKNGSNYWKIDGFLQSKLGIAEVKNIYNLPTNKRAIEYNGSKITNSELAKLTSIIWLTPQMEWIFQSGLTDRRRFLDRIVYSFIQSHASSVNKYEHYLQERMKILEQGMDNDSWVDIIEDKIAQESLIIASNRTEVLNKLQQAIEATESEFPKARLTIEDGLTNRLEQNELSKEQILEEMRSQLKARRKADKAAGRTTFGVHRSEFLVTHAENNQLAKFCSTGQQKALLITIILAQVNSIIRETGIRPILLLDEVFVHLDDRRKKYLSEFFIESKMQLWVTATDLTGIKDLADLSNVVDL